MRVFAVALTLSVVVLAGSAQAQVPAPATQKPAAPAPAAPAAQAPPIVPFQEGLKYAYVILARVAAEANEGKAAADRVRKFNDDKAAELNNKNKALQAAQDRLEKGGTVMSDAARSQLQTDIERQTRDLQRSQEDAQQDFQNFQQQVQLDFNNKLNPIVDKVAKAKGVHFVFSAQDAGLIWADPSLDLTNDVIKEFNTSAPAPAATAKPVAPAPATTAKPAAGTTK